MTGIRMSTALWNGRHVKASNITNRQDGYCCDGCGTSVSFVNEHVVRKDDPELERTVPAFFRLKRGVFHQTGCKYTPFGQVDQLVKKANAVEDGGENPFVQQAPNGPIEFRLNIATDAKQGLYDPKDGKEAGKKFAERVARVWSGDTLSNYCRSATGLRYQNLNINLHHAAQLCEVENPDDPNERD
ncbi:MAG: hypothetical protein HWE30_15725 [Methylocystaceae bacterium]|nr:hypothetical protein [Methylocystaceae bacterium]